MAKLAEPLMKDGGTVFCMTYFGPQRVVEHYNLMGPVKAALECATRYMAAELVARASAARDLAGALPDPRSVRDRLLRRHAGQGSSRGPKQRLISIDDVGLATAYLATDAAKLLTGETLYIDGGYHVID